MGRFFVCLIVLAFAFLILPAGWAQEAAETAGDEAATRQFDFANGLFVRGEAFYGQAAEQYRLFLREYPTDARCDEALFRLGECMLKTGKPHEALKAYTEHTTRFPTSTNAARVTLRRGQVLGELGRRTDAIAAFRSVIGGPADAELKQAACYRLGTVLLEDGQMDEAIKVLDAIAGTAGDPFQPYALYQLGLAYVERGEDDKAVERLRQLALVSVELAPEALFRVGEIEFKRDRYPEAAAAYRGVVTTYAESTYAGAAAYGLVQSLARARQFAETIEAYGTLRDLVPPPVRPQTDYLVANAQYELGRYDAALQLYDGVVQAAPKTELAVRAELKMAWCRYFLRDDQALVAAAVHFIDEHPRHPDADTAHYLAGEALLRLGRPADALLHYETIVKDFGDSSVLAEAAFKIGWCLFAQNQFETARRRFLAFADERPTETRAAEAVARAAECSIKLVKMHDAVADYERLLRDYPTSELAEGALFQLGLAYVSLDEQDQAVAVFSDFVAKHPDSKQAADAYYWIGSQQEKAGELDAAIVSLTHSIEAAKHNETEAHPFVERANYKLATIYHGQEKYEQAAAILLAMLEQNPDAEVPAKSHLWAAGYFLEHEQHTKAKGLYENFLRKFPTDPTVEEAHFGFGECLAHETQWNKALEQYRKAMECAGSLTMLAQLRAAVALHRLGKHDEAAALLTPLLKAEQPAIEAEALYWLGTIDFLQASIMSDSTKAAELYDKAQGSFLRVVILYGNAPHRAECMLRTAECQLAVGRQEDAIKQYDQLIAEYADSPLADEARAALHKLGADTPASDNEPPESSAGGSS